MGEKGFHFRVVKIGFNFRVGKRDLILGKDKLIYEKHRENFD